MENKFNEKKISFEKKQHAFHTYLMQNIVPVFNDNNSEINSYLYGHLTAFEKILKLIPVQIIIEYGSNVITSVICGMQFTGASVSLANRWEKEKNTLAIPYYEKYGKELPEDSIQFVQNILDQYQCEIKISGHLSCKKDNQEYSYSYIDSEIILENTKYKLGYKRDDLQASMNVIKENMTIDLMNNFKETIKHDKSIPECEIEDEWDKVYYSTFKNSGHSKELLKNTISSFIWQIKRKTFGNRVEYARMLILYGPQGTGKSSFFTKGIFSICPKMVFDCANMQDLFEGKLIHVFDAPIVFFDELGKATKTEITNIKNKITSEYVDVRPMFTNNTVSKKNLNIYCGTTNKQLSSQICDDTGMRRFIQLNVIDNVDIKMAEKIDWLKIWKSVDETCSEDPLANDTLELKEMQDGLRSESLVEEFLSEKKYEFSKKVKISDLRDEFTDYVRRLGRMAPTNKQFKNEIIEAIKKDQKNWVYYDGTNDKKPHTLEYIG